jgi:plasmid maintenance system antidote protein VapI
MEKIMKKECVAVHIEKGTVITATSISKMAKLLNVDRSTVSRVISGDRSKKTVKGYVVQ